MKGLNLSKFKKVAEDNATTTLHSPEGHRIVVAHKAVNPKLREALKKLPTYKAQGGGLVEDILHQDDSGMAKGGKVKAMADGGDPTDDSSPQQSTQTDDPTADLPQQPANVPPVINVNVGGQPQQTSLPGGGDAYASMYGIDPHAPPKPYDIPNDPIGAAYAKGYNDQLVQKQAGVQQPGLLDPAAVAKPEPTPASAIVPLQRQPAATQPNPIAAANAQMMGGINNQIAGTQQEAQAKAAAADVAMPAQKEYADSMQRVNDEFQGRLYHYNKINDQLVNDMMTGQIDPNRYINSLSTGERILNTIGTLIGGAGAGLAGFGGNPFLDQINKHIDRDIDAQKATLGVKKSLLDANMQQYHNEIEAVGMTKGMMYSAAQAKILSDAAKYNNPQIMAAAKQAVGALQVKKGELMKQTAINSMLMGGEGGSGADPDRQMSILRVVAPEIAKERESRYLPGIGFSSVPIAEGTRGKIVASQDFDRQMKALYSWAQNHSGVTPTSPENIKAINYGKALAQNAQNSYRGAQDMGVWKASEAPLLEGELPQDPSAFMNKIRVLPKYKAIMDSNSRKLNTLLQSVGAPSVPQASDFSQHVGAPILKK